MEGGPGATAHVEQAGAYGADARVVVSKTGEEHRGKLSNLDREVRWHLARQWEALQRQAAAVPE